MSGKPYRIDEARSHHSELQDSQGSLRNSWLGPRVRVDDDWELGMSLSSFTKKVPFRVRKRNLRSDKLSRSHAALSNFDRRERFPRDSIHVARRGVKRPFEMARIAGQWNRAESIDEICDVIVGMAWNRYRPERAIAKEIDACPERSHYRSCRKIKYSKTLTCLESGSQQRLVPETRFESATNEFSLCIQCRNAAGVIGMEMCEKYSPRMNV